MNDTAFVFEQSNEIDISISILNWVVERHPNRTVAYINLSDALAKKKEHKKAVDAAKRYVELMKKNGRSNKIPSRIIERVKDK